MESPNHKVLVFGENVYGKIKPKLHVEYCEIDTCSFPLGFNSMCRLGSYDLVILDYRAFVWDTRLYKKEQDIFDKQMTEALEKGCTFCILHYDEQVPKDYKYEDEHFMQDEDIQEFSQKQIGFRWLNRLKVRPKYSETLLANANYIKNEYKAYLNRWGASHIYFIKFSSNREIGFGDLIYSLSDDLVLGFCLGVYRGRIIFLPCQRNFDHEEDIKICLETLIDNTITYLTHSIHDMPEWLESPIFQIEKNKYDEVCNLRAVIVKLEEQLETYRNIKSLVFLKGYDFEEAIPKFIKNQLEIETLRNDKFKEDFWVLDSKSEKAIIGETKTYSKGMKRSGIYSIHNHREENKLDANFPALLIVNCHLNANSWKEKLRPIDPQIYQIALNNHVLIMRIEDLIFLWNSIKEKKFAQEDLLDILSKNIGWLEVTSNGDLNTHS